MWRLQVCRLCHVCAIVDEIALLHMLALWACVGKIDDRGTDSSIA
jgi:hypothetical protein